MKTIHLNNQVNLSDSINSVHPAIPLRVILQPGIYRQKVRITRGNFKLIGEEEGKVIITYSDYNDKIHEDGLQYNTFRTPSMSLFGDHVYIRNITIKNESGRGTGVGQAVALSLYGDDITLENCHLSGYQDTLFLGPLPLDLIERYKNFLQKEELLYKNTNHRFKNCTIDGDVDFIFGSATAVFDHCTINVRNNGYIAAPSTSQDTLFGFVFYKCNIINRSVDEVYLARPWREYGSTIFIECKFSGKFHQERYHSWEKSNYRFFEYPYVDCSLSKPLNREELEQLMGIINCS